MKKETGMKILVTFYSQTGNTRKVAETIYKELEGENDLRPLEEVTSLEGYDLVFIGFPVIQFGPPRIVRRFLTDRAGGKKIAMFVTHASWDSEELRPALDAWLGKCRSAASGSDLVGFFDCRGELSESSAKLFLMSEIPEVRYFGSLQPQTKGHPDEMDLGRARDFTKIIITKFQR